MLKSRDSRLAPEYLRIPHLRGFGSRMTVDDIDTDFPRADRYYLQEKADGSNSGVSWLDEGPLLRNRTHILRKGFPAKTPAKKQFVPAFNWCYQHEDDIREVLTRLGSPGTIYGEWLWAEHSLGYSRLPDFFLAYDVWSEDAQKYVSPSRLTTLLDGTGISYIPPTLYLPESIQAGLVTTLNEPSQYREGIREGVVMKTTDAVDEWITGHYKIVREDFPRMDDEWNNRPMKRNKLRR